MTALFTTETLADVVEAIDDIIDQPNAKFVSIPDDVVADSEKPWGTTHPEETKHDCKIVFDNAPGSIEKTTRYRSNTQTQAGQIVGYMYPYSAFTPTLKDQVIRNSDNKVLTISGIDEIRPVDDVVLYVLEFAT